MAKLTELTPQELHLLIDIATMETMPHRCVPTEIFLGNYNYMEFNRFQHIKDKYKYPNYKTKHLKIIGRVINKDFGFDVPLHKILKFESRQKIIDKLNKTIKKESKYDEFVRQIQLEKDVILTKKQITKIWEMKASGQHYKLISKYIDSCISKRIQDENKI